MSKDTLDARKILNLTSSPMEAAILVHLRHVHSVSNTALLYYLILTELVWSKTLTPCTAVPRITLRVKYNILIT